MNQVQNLGNLFKNAGNGIVLRVVLVREFQVRRREIEFVLKIDFGSQRVPPSRVWFCHLKYVGRGRPILSFLQNSSFFYVILAILRIRVTVIQQDLGYESVVSWDRPAVSSLDLSRSRR